MARALLTYLEILHRSEDPVAAVTAAAESVARDPWQVVTQAGRLARCRIQRAEEDIGLTAELRVRRAGGRGVVANIPAGALYPTFAHAGRKDQGTFDTPRDMARQTVALALGAARGRVVSGVDTACGTGAFLVAMQEAGLDRIEGSDIDALALAVARVAAPRANLVLRDALEPGAAMDLVVGNPPFVPPERQGREQRQALQQRFPWLHGRYDLAIPFAAAAVERARAGGGVGLVLPASVMVQPYGAALRRMWLRAHAVEALCEPVPFDGAVVNVVLLALAAGVGPSEALPSGVRVADVLRLESCPLDARLRPGSVELIERVRERSIPLGELCRVDTGVVAHGPLGGKAALLHDSPGEGRVPYADARDFFEGRQRWLRYAPELMHRAKSRDLFEVPKLVIQRIRGERPVRAALDRAGVYVGHTCTVVVPKTDAIALEHLLDLVRSPLVDGLVRLERGRRLDLYPHDVASFPVPSAWLRQPGLPLAEAWGLSPAEVETLADAAAG